MVLRPRGFSQIYVRIGLEEQSRQSKAGKKAKQAQSKQNAADHQVNEGIHLYVTAPTRSRPRLATCNGK